MKMMIFLMSVVFTSFSFAVGPIGTLGTLPTLTIGGTSFPNYNSDTTFVVLVANTFTHQWSSFRQPGVNSDYQVPSGKTLYVWAVDENVATSANNIYAVGWGTAGIGFDSAAGPSGQVYPYGDLAHGNVYFQNTGDGRASTTFIMQVPQNMYPFINNGSLSMVFRIYGYVK